MNCLPVQFVSEPVYVLSACPVSVSEPVYELPARPVSVSEPAYELSACPVSVSEPIDELFVFPASVLETVYARSVSFVSVFPRSQSLPWVYAPPMSQIWSISFPSIATRGRPSIILTLTLHRLLYYTLDYISHHPLR